MADSAYVPVRNFTAFSMLEGALQPKELAKACARLGLPAAAITDRNALFAAMEFSDAAKGAGIQPIIGVTLGIERPDGMGAAPRLSLVGAARRPTIDWLVLLAQCEEGYANLIRLVSRAHMGSDPAEGVRLPLADLDGATRGLIALTAGAEGAVCRLLADGQEGAAEAYLARLSALFGDRLYAEVVRTDDPIEAASEAALVALADAAGVPLAATNPARFAEAAMHRAHDVMLCIADGAYIESGERRRSNAAWHLRDADSMAERFSDLPDAVAHTVEIARRCGVMAPSRKPILPRVGANEDALLAERAEAGLADRLAVHAKPPADPQPYLDRLRFEVDVINRMGFAGYFLIVADFIQWAKGQGIPVGPGRGSGAGSLVAWSLTITDLDPIQHGLLFERFLNPERVSMPDFDIDFCETRREEVIRYVQSRYGHDQVAQIITFGKLKARAVLKDVGRVLQMPYGQVDRLAKLVPNHPSDPWTLERAVEGVPELSAEMARDPKVRQLVDLSLRLEGLPRHASTHAAGVVIGDRPLAELVPIYRDPRSDMPVTQFDMKWVEKAGLVKFDFLGLKTLSVLQRALELLKRRGVTLDLSALPEDDPAAYALMARGDTVGVFQLESEGMRRTLAAVKPTTFGDIVALVSLYRPGPMDNIPLFGARKNGREPVEYPHPLLKDILAETYGIFVYQEQVMQAAQVLAGYSLGQADLLRRAMGKKIKAEMDAQRAGFVAGCTANGIGEAKANELFDLIDKFAGYGFNKSHAAAYALIAYQTAYLKAHHPVEFFAASMAYDIALTDKLCTFVEDMRRMGVKCLPPCVNASEADFTVEGLPEGGWAVRYALGALKGVGEKAMAAVVEERWRRGSFASLSDFASRIDPKLLNKRQIEALAAAGAFDGLEPNRAGCHAMAEALLASANAVADARSSGQGGLFGEAVDLNLELFRADAPKPWTMAETMAQERGSFGFYFSGHPVDGWRHVTEAHRCRSYGDICAGPAAPGGKGSATMAAMVEAASWRTPNGAGRDRRYLMVTLSDGSGQFIGSCFDAEVQPAVEKAAAEGAVVLLQAELLWREGEDMPRVTVRGLTSVDQLAKRARARLLVEIEAPQAVAALNDLLSRGGRGEVWATVRLPGGPAARLLLGRDFSIDVETARAAERLAGVRAAELSAVEPPRLALVG